MREILKRTGIIGVGMLALFLVGCGGVEPEKRDYPMTLAFGHEDGSNYVIYGMANLNEVTEQGKGEQDTPEVLKIRGESMSEIHEEYAKTQQYYLDLGHVQAVIFDKSLLDDKESYGKVVEEMQGIPEIGKNAYVFRTTRLEEIMITGQEKEDSLGEYLRGMYENHMKIKKKGLTLEDLYYEWNNFGVISKIPTLNVKDGQVVLCEDL